MRSFAAFFDLRLTKRLSKQSCEAGYFRCHRAHHDVIVMHTESAGNLGLVSIL